MKFLLIIGMVRGKSKGINILDLEVGGPIPVPPTLLGIREVLFYTEGFVQRHYSLTVSTDMGNLIRTLIIL